MKFNKVNKSDFKYSSNKFLVKKHLEADCPEAFLRAHLTN